MHKFESNHNLKRVFFALKALVFVFFSYWTFSIRSGSNTSILYVIWLLLHEMINSLRLFSLGTVQFGRWCLGTFSPQASATYGKLMLTPLFAICSFWSPLTVKLKGQRISFCSLRCMLGILQKNDQFEGMCHSPNQCRNHILTNWQTVIGIEWDHWVLQWSDFANVRTNPDQAGKQVRA